MWASLPGHDVTLVGFGKVHGGFSPSAAFSSYHSAAYLLVGCTTCGACGMLLVFVLLFYLNGGCVVGVAASI
ncbi:unnamed protein product [Ilex paraguariensis]|uniref:Transmembrane protein n=1 Tax=Ilex paraguariensis TaxID=185542 RepID=A0ABC8T7G6_9AQUA